MLLCNGVTVTLPITGQHQPPSKEKRGLVSVQHGLPKNIRGSLKNSRMILMKFNSPASHVLTKPIHSTIPLIGKSNLVRRSLQETLAQVFLLEFFKGSFSRLKGFRLFFLIRGVIPIFEHSPLQSTGDFVSLLQPTEVGILNKSRTLLLFG